VKITPLSQVPWEPADEQHQFQNPADQPFKFICLIPAKFEKC